MSLDMKIFDELKAKLQNSKIKFDEMQHKSKDKLDEAITETKGNINATKTNYELWAKDKKSDIFAESLKMKMSLEFKFNELKSSLNEKKFEHDKSKKQAMMEKSKERAEHAAGLAIWAIEEAELAYLEAIAAENDYMETYGSDEDKDKK